LFNNFK